MAAGDFTVVNTALLNIANGTFDLDSDTWYCALVTSAHTPSLSDDTYSDISSSVTTDPDYSAVDQNISTSGSTGTVTVDSNDANFGTTVTITAKYAYILKGNEASPSAGDLVLGYCDLNTSGGSVSSTSGDFVVQWNAAGLFTIQRAP